MALKSFIDVGPGSHFLIQSMPFGVFWPDSGSPAQPGVTIRDGILDLPAVASAGLFGGPALAGSDCFHQVGRSCGLVPIDHQIAFLFRIDLAPRGSSGGLGFTGEAVPEGASLACCNRRDGGGVEG
ncbi:hypothetical protein NL676_028011 [Syzygium grande]|nr:hypothetical protein NL676_028011 [Syzygium grande]